MEAWQTYPRSWLACWTATCLAGELSTSALGCRGSEGKWSGWELILYTTWAGGAVESVATGVMRHLLTI